VAEAIIAAHDARSLATHAGTGHRQALRSLAAAGHRIAAQLMLVLTGEPGAGQPDHQRSRRSSGGWRAALEPCVAGRLEDALAAIERVCRTGGGTPDEAQALSLAAICYHTLGATARAGATASCALAAAQQSGHPSALVAAHRGMALVAAADGDATADRHAVAAGELEPGADHELLLLMVCLNRAGYLLTQGESAPARAAAESALQLGRRSGHACYEPYALSLAAAAKSQLGLLESALADAAASQRLRQAMATNSDAGFGLAVLGQVHCRRREARQARVALEAALPTVTGGSGEQPLAPGESSLLAWVLAALARVRAADDPASARILAEQAVALGEEAGRVAGLLARGWVALTTGDPKSASQDAAEARTIAALGGQPTALAETLELMALSAPAPKTALGLLDDAAAQCRLTGDLPAEARIRLVAARLRGAAGRRAAAAAEDQLRRHGVRLEPGIADGLTALAQSAPPISVQSLGEFQVHRGGEPVTPREWQSRKARDLLKILIAHRGRPVPRTRLIELLWPDQPPARTRNRLSVLLSTLRRVLDAERRIGTPGPIIADRETVSVDLDVVEVDVEQFLEAAATAQAAHRGDGRAVALLSAAEGLYSGEFLADDPYADWAQPLREEVTATYVSLLGALVSQATDTNQQTLYLLRLLRCDPYDEEAHLQLCQRMRDAGRHGEANRRYQIYVQRMRELGVPARPVQPSERPPTGDKKSAVRPRATGPPTMAGRT
jgi:DNA-binding SARP family transcriptional activator